MMIEGLEIRESNSADREAIERLYLQAFPDEDLLPLVRDLLSAETGVLSLVAQIDAEVAGHVIFTICSISQSDANVALLGPLAVAPAWQRQGIGKAIIRAGLHRLEADGVQQVFALGDPAYYGRSGFAAEADVAPPYPLPEEWRGAWQSRRLGASRLSLKGQLAVPRPWRQRSLWTS